MMTVRRLMRWVGLRKNGPSSTSFVIWEYPTELLETLPKIAPETRTIRDRELVQQHKETLARIGERVDEVVALEKEKIAALSWCRANKNPHLKEGK